MCTLTKYFYPIIFIFASGMIFIATEALAENSVKIKVEADKSFLGQYNKNDENKSDQCTFAFHIGWSFIKGDDLGTGVFLLPGNSYSSEIYIPQSKVKDGDFSMGIINYYGCSTKDPGHIYPTKSGSCTNFTTITLTYKNNKSQYTCTKSE